MTALIERSAPRNGVVELRFNRPDKRNALNIAMLEAFCEGVEAANADSAVRAIVVRGNGAVFCAGLDLKEATDPAHSHRSAELVARALTALYNSPKVTIAAVHGAAIAGGAGLMSACDIAIGTVDSKFCYPEVRRGLVAGLVMTFLRRQVAERHARELLVLGEIIDGDHAERIGLITRAVPSDLLDENVDLVIDQVLKSAPGAIALSKAFFDQLHQRPVAEDLDAALGLHVKVRDGGEAQEGMRAFLEKRKPAWEPETFD